MQKNDALPGLFTDATDFGSSIVCYILFIAVSALLFLAAVMRPALAEENAGVILVLTGKVEVEHAGKTLPAARMNILFSGDIIATGDDGQVQIRFVDGTMLSLYRDTRFAVNDYHYDNGKNDRAQFSLMNGLMHTLTGQIDKRNYLLKTRLANLGVRGTEYSVQLGNTLNVSVDQGLVELVNAGGKILVGAGQSAIVTEVNAIPKPAIGGKIPLPMHDHGSHGGGGPDGHGGVGLGDGRVGGSMAAPPPSGTQNFQRNHLPGGPQPPVGPQPPAGPQPPVGPQPPAGPRPPVGPQPPAGQPQPPLL